MNSPADFVVQRYDSAADIPEPARKLFGCGNSAGFYHSYEWYQALEVSFNKGDSALYVIAYSDSEPIALMPLKIGPRSWFANLGARTASSATTIYSVHYQPLYAASSPDLTEICTLIINKILHGQNRPDLIRLDMTDFQDPFLAALISAFKLAGLRTNEFLNFANRYEILESSKFDDYLMSRSSKFRSEIRRRIKRLETDIGTIVFDIHSSPDSTRDALKKFNDVYAKSWKGDEDSPEFLRELVRLSSEAGVCRIGLLSVEGKLLAGKLSFVSDGKLAMYKTAYDPEYKKYGPGTLINYFMIRDVMHQDILNEIDFGIGDETYKSLWVDSRRERRGLISYNTSRPLGFANLLIHTVWSYTKKIIKAVGFKNRKTLDVVKERHAEMKELNKMPDSASSNNLRKLMADVLQLGDRAADLEASTPLLGNLPELDSMAVATLIAAMEETFDIYVEDDEISAETFETFGSLCAFVELKLAG